MNIIDMGFWQATGFPTNSVENGCRATLKIGKSRPREGGSI